MKDNIKITFYEPWMKSQIISLFENEYGIDRNNFENLMTKLYEHPIQKDKCIQLVALDDNLVVGFQSFFYWPYTYNNKSYKSLQSGNSIIHPNYRGRGIFQKLINYIFYQETSIDVDFLLGFPVEESFKSFTKNKWINIFDLKWYVKVINPFGFLFNFKTLLKEHNHYLPLKSDWIEPFFNLQKESTFYNWKNDLKNNSFNYFYYEYKISETTAIIFEIKIQSRKKIIHEAIIGKIQFIGNSREYLKNALSELLNHLKKHKCITICSIAINEHFKSPDYATLVKELKFKAINKKIHFIIKPLKTIPEIHNPSLWDIGRADIDTW